MLAGPLGLLPLAPLADLQAADLAGVVRALERRIDAEATPEEAQSLEVVTYTLLGLRYPPELARQIMPGVRNMRESTTYQEILAEGRQEGRQEGREHEARQFLLFLGTERFGTPGTAARTALDQISTVERLEQLGRRLLVVTSWDELLAER